MDGKDPNAVDIMVPSKDPEKEEDLTPKHDKGKQRQDEKDEPEIVSRPSAKPVLAQLSSVPRITSLLTQQSEEDLQLKTELEMLVERLKVS